MLNISTGVFNMMSVGERRLRTASQTKMLNLF